MTLKDGPKCASCRTYSCWKGEKDTLPAFCPGQSGGQAYEKAAVAYRGEDGDWARAAALVEARGYGSWPRLREIAELADRLNIKRLGLAFCVGLRREAAEVARILEENGFTVFSAMCKAGSRPKEDLGLGEKDKVRPGAFEAMCNPVAQAILLNEAGVELNVLLGLCAGHDTLFIKHAAAPVTVLAVKDRVTGHNPLAAVYAAHYFGKKLKMGPKSQD